MTTKDNTPPEALKIDYILEGYSMPYYVWERKGEWYWSALGNSGKAQTQEQAQTAARRWIKTGQ